MKLVFDIQWINLKHTHTHTTASVCAGIITQYQSSEKFSSYTVKFAMTFREIDLYTIQKFGVSNFF